MAWKELILTTRRDFPSVDHGQDVQQPGGDEKLRPVIGNMSGNIGLMVAEPNGEKVRQPTRYVRDEPAVLYQTREHIAGAGWLEHGTAHEQAHNEAGKDGGRENGPAAATGEEKMAGAGNQPSGGDD